jgi:hypothetical protein
MNIYAQIIKREFEAATDVPARRVLFTENEEIVVLTPRDRFVMTIGSDDDGFWFRSDNTGCVIEFAFPQDWLDLEADGRSWALADWEAE